MPEQLGMAKRSRGGSVAIGGAPCELQVATLQMRDLRRARAPMLRAYADSGALEVLERVTQLLGVYEVVGTARIIQTSVARWFGVDG
jgi:hypothetical protein